MLLQWSAATLCVILQLTITHNTTNIATNTATNSSANEHTINQLSNSPFHRQNGSNQIKYDSKETHLQYCRQAINNNEKENTY